MDVLITGGDTELGRIIATSFREEDHRVVIMGKHRDDLEVTAKELELDAIVADNTDAASLENVRHQLPHHIDNLVNVPVLDDHGDPRTFTLTQNAAAWRSALDRTLLSAVLTVQLAGDNLRSGGSIVNVVADAIPEHVRDGSAEAAIKAALSNWTAGQAAVFGTRGITVNAVASGKSAQPGYDGLAGTQPPVAEEISRLALFLATPAARHITGQTLHVSRGVPARLG